jgi:hypothetical protein
MFNKPGTNMDADRIKPKAYAIMYSGILGLFLLAFILNTLLPTVVVGISRFFAIGMIMGLFWFSFYIIAVPRCPKCGLGLFSVIEIKKVPIIVKSWVGNHCFGCGVEVK